MLPWAPGGERPAAPAIWVGGKRKPRERARTKSGRNEETRCAGAPSAQGPERRRPSPLRDPRTLSVARPPPGSSCSWLQPSESRNFSGPYRPLSVGPPPPPTPRLPAPVPGSPPRAPAPRPACLPRHPGSVEGAIRLPVTRCGSRSPPLYPPRTRGAWGRDCTSSFRGRRGEGITPTTKVQRRKEAAAQAGAGAAAGAPRPPPLQRGRRGYSNTALD